MSAAPRRPRPRFRTLALSALVLAGPPAFITGLLAVAASQRAEAQQDAVLAETRFGPEELRVQALELRSPQTLRVEAVGAEPGGLHRFARARNAIIRVARQVFDIDEPDDASRGWPANAWIVDATTREVVWDLRSAETRRWSDGLRAFEGDVRLPAGTYEVYYAVETGASPGDDFSWHFDHGSTRELKLVIRGNALRPTDRALQRARDGFRERAIVSLTGARRDVYQKAGFALDRTTEVELYALGEVSERNSYDYGWILDADTREKVWALTYEGSQHAGGTDRNRVVRETLTLPAGRYVAFYVTDRSHAPGDWTDPPPVDPEFWGLTLRVMDGEVRAAVQPFVYDPAPADRAIVTLTRIHDDEHRSRGFTLTEPLDVRIFAIGEGRGGDMYDYGWIADARTRERVWTLTYEETEHAGGGEKNRLFDGVIRLEPGSYIVSYVSDGSHGFDDWNTPPPIDREHYGITVLPAVGVPETGVVLDYDPRTDPAILVQLVEIGNSQTSRRRFSLDAPTDLRVYALGEGVSDRMVDSAWIEDGTGRTVWRMRYEETAHAGGARKNRVFNRVVALPAGDYELVYRSDGSHAFGSWNADPPYDFASYGVVLYRTDAH